jgi:hypothetical protein
MRALIALTIVVGALAATPPIPTLPLDWTANEEDFMVVYQGDYTVSGGLYCCGDTSCEVQTQYQSGMNYFDFSHNRTRFDDPVNGDFVTLFNPIYKEMLVVNNACQEYCPVEDDLEPYSIDPTSTYQGQKSVNGHTCNDWQYKDKEFGIVFEIDDTLVDATTALPVMELDQLTPFGQAIGEETSTYHSFVPGTPDPSHFQISGVDNCQMSQNCGNSKRQFLRRRWGMHKTWAKYYTEANLAKAKARARPHVLKAAGQN